MPGRFRPGHGVPRWSAEVFLFRNCRRMSRSVRSHEPLFWRGHGTLRTGPSAFHSLLVVPSGRKIGQPHGDRRVPLATLAVDRTNRHAAFPNRIHQRFADRSIDQSIQTLRILHEDTRQKPGRSASRETERLRSILSGWSVEADTPGISITGVTWSTPFPQADSESAASAYRMALNEVPGSQSGLFRPGFSRHLRT